MSRKSLKFKFIISICGIVFSLLIIGNIMIITFQNSILNIVIIMFQNQIEKMINNRKNADIESLNKNIIRSANIFSKSISNDINNYAFEDINNSLKNFINFSEMQAIKICENDNSLMVTAYKTPDIKISDHLPSDYNLKNYIVYKNNVLFEDEIIATIWFYYSDQKIIELIKSIKNEENNILHKTINNIRRKINKIIYYQIVGIFIVILLLIICIIVCLNILVLRPIDRITQIAEGLSNFDLSLFNVTIKRKDEIGFLYSSIEKMIQAFRSIILEIQLKSTLLTQTSDSLVSIASKLSKNSKKIKNEADNVASATVDMNSSISTIASETEQMNNNTKNTQASINNMSNNINVVANSIEEMVVSMNQIKNNAQQGKDVTTNALKMTKHAENLINTITAVAKDIGIVTKIIKQIAKKTDILAINTSIEASLLNEESGQGFRVISNEIKRFATQSKKFAEEISINIDNMKQISIDIIDFITNITEIVQKINISEEQIFLNIDQQNFAAQKIASNAVQSSFFAKNMKQNIYELTIGFNDVKGSTSTIADRSNDVTNNIQEISIKISDNYSITRDIHKAAEKINNYAFEFKDIVSTFKLPA